MKNGRYSDSQGNYYWFKNDLLHREEDLPAVELFDGKKLWYKEGVLHRNGEPAIITFNEEYMWYQHGLLHREDGPAYVWKFIFGDVQQWYLNGIEYSEEDFYEYLKKKKISEQLESELKDSSIYPKQTKI